MWWIIGIIVVVVIVLLVVTRKKGPAATGTVEPKEESTELPGDNSENKPLE